MARQHDSLVGVGSMNSSCIRVDINASKGTRPRETIYSKRHPHREGIGGGVRRGYGYWQPEREGYRAGSEGVVAESLERSYPWAVGFFFGNVELSLELWTVISGISGSDD